ncbi:hypothetical protein NCS52_01327000 [Fusarium sp. LHS14.1]|nr:hypothetical protein NCS52_01327000 [Fusarium sp. LHS14.1]
MDPLSIAAGCAGLITAIGGLSINLHSFVRTCREARGDLDSVSRELLSLQIILELIKEDASDSSKPFPKTLNQHVTAIIGNPKIGSRPEWPGLSTPPDERDQNRNDTAAIKEDTTQILEEIARLQARLPPDAAAAASNDFILQRFFEEMTTYTEQALDVNSSKRLSFDEGPEEGVAPLLQQDSWPYHSMPSSSKQSSRGESWASSQIQNPYRDSEATSNTSFPTIVNESHGEREDTLDRSEDTYDKDTGKNASTARQEISGFEIPVPDKLTNKYPSSFRHEREFARCRHSTITCSPEKFAKLDFTFRHVGFEPPRQIKIVLFFSISSSEDTDSFYRRWNFMIASCSFAKWQPVVPSWKQILVHINCDTSLDRIDPLIRKYLHQKGILNTHKSDIKTIVGGTIQAEIVEYTIYPDLNPIQVILTAYCKGSNFHVPGVEMIYSQVGWYHPLCALLGVGMVITIPDDPSEIPERRSEHTQFLSEVWANKRDISGLRTYNGIYVTSVREYLSMPMRKRPKPKGIFAKIRTSFS